jgi:hypothetical protein
MLRHANVCIPLISPQQSQGRNRCCRVQTSTRCLHACTRGSTWAWPPCGTIASLQCCSKGGGCQGGHGDDTQWSAREAHSEVIELTKRRPTRLHWRQHRCGQVASTFAAFPVCVLRLDRDLLVALMREGVISDSDTCSHTGAVGPSTTQGGR